MRVGGRSRVGVPLSSFCDYFEVAPDRRTELAALPPRDADGKPERVFWEAKERAETSMATAKAGGKTIEVRGTVGSIRPVAVTGIGDDSREIAEVLNT